MEEDVESYTFLGCVKNRYIFAKFIIELAALAVVE